MPLRTSTTNPIRCRDDASRFMVLLPLCCARRVGERAIRGCEHFCAVDSSRTPPRLSGRVAATETPHHNRPHGLSMRVPRSSVAICRRMGGFFALNQCECMSRCDQRSRSALQPLEIIRLIEPQSPMVFLLNSKSITDSQRSFPRPNYGLSYFGRAIIWRMSLKCSTNKDCTRPRPHDRVDDHGDEVVDNPC